jgi:hypothetical protein
MELGDVLYFVGSLGRLDLGRRPHRAAAVRL